MKILVEPNRQYLIITLIVVALSVEFFFAAMMPLLVIASIVGSVPTAIAGIKGLFRLKITIEAFNLFAILISFSLGEYRSAAFIALMLTVAAILEWRTSSKTRDAVSELLALKPRTAMIEKDGKPLQINAEDLKEGDEIIINAGSRVPADGLIISGTIFINEAPVTGESTPVFKEAGDKILTGTLADSGVVKAKVTSTGKESTLERMAALIREAANNKSRSERIADKFATIFLPAVLVFGGLVYYFTRDPKITASIFLVACADDMAVAIPLAVSASIGEAARRGVIVKGGEWLSVLANAKSVILDKTGTLTYGVFSLKTINIIEGIDHTRFWKLVGALERYSEHPVGRAIFKESIKRVEIVPDHENVRTIKGVGLIGEISGETVAIGNVDILKYVELADASLIESYVKSHNENAETFALVIINNKFVGSFGISDIPRPEARKSIARLQNLGVSQIAMYTGDNAEVARVVAGNLGIRQVFAALSPEDKLRKIETMPKPMIMVGDGINDAPALSRADVGIAMGSGGTAVAVEAADVVILTDNIARLPDMIELGRRTTSVIRWDIIIWVLTNAVGFTLALTGVISPALAAFYNFATDFLPLINSARLYTKTQS